MQRRARIDEQQRQTSALSNKVSPAQTQRRVSKLRLRLNLNTSPDDERPREHSKTKKSNLKNLLNTFISERKNKSKKRNNQQLVKS